MAKGAVGQRLEDKYDLESGQIYLSGLQALVRLPMDQRRRDQRDGRRTAAFVSGYEGSPLAGYDLELAHQQATLDRLGIAFSPGVNEELAATAVHGSQIAATMSSRTVDGVAGYWYGKAPGLDRAADAFRHANIAGTSATGGAAVLVGDDSTAKSSSVPCASERMLAELGIPVLVPADPQGILDLGIHAIEMSRFSGLFVGLKIATNVADGSATARVDPDRVKVVLPTNVVDGAPYVHQPDAGFGAPTLAGHERSLLGARLELARRYASANDLNKVHDAPEARVGIVAAGGTYLETRQALDKLGLESQGAAAAGVRVLELGMVWPLDPELVRSFSEGLEEIVVVEEKRSFIETGIKEILYGLADAPAVTGKRSPEGTELFRHDSDLDADRIAEGLARRFKTRLDWQPPASTTPAATSTLVGQRLTVVNRTPYFCSGCPHNRSTAVPDGSLVGAGIGCHAMVGLVPESRRGAIVGLTQMGGEGANWIGIAPFVEEGHIFQNLGDGTFHHSGSLAVRAAVASGHNVTYKLLYNDAVAMTGGQEAVGGMSVPDVARSLLAEGVQKVVITTEDLHRYRKVRLPRGVRVRHRDELVEIQTELSQTPGVTVLIHDQECAAVLRRKRKRGKAPDPPQRAFINERVCEGCGDCGVKSNCLSVLPIETEYGRKTHIHQPSCNKDYSCLDGDCPSFLAVVPRSGPRQRRVAPDIDAAVLPEPRLVVDPRRFSMRITGVGGTGVVTVAQVLATAAARAGLWVRALDQTGMAQKGGAVVSDIKLTRDESELSSKVGRGECDLYLGCDVLVAAADDNLATASSLRTVAVVSTSEVPTGSMVADTAMSFPGPESTVDRIARQTRADAGRFVDARAATIDLFGDDQYANIFLIGVAFQAGALPIPASEIEAAILLNNVAVDRNLQAFRRGRQLVADPEEYARATGHESVANENPPTLTELVDSRAAELVAYQDAAYAERFRVVVAEVRNAEERTVPGSDEFTEAVARHLFKLMAYKDEYEVARLSIRPELQRELEAEFGPGARYHFRLHPPVLRALGMRRKISLGPWFAVVFRLLYALRRVRGTRLDPFGYARVRRVERALVEEYRALVLRVAADLRPGTIGDAARIASLPDVIRGYEHIKLDNVERYRAELARHLAEFDADSVATSSAGASNAETKESR